MEQQIKQWPTLVSDYKELDEVFESIGRGTPEHVYVRAAGMSYHLPTDPAALWWFWDRTVGFATCAVQHPSGRVLLDFEGLGYTASWWKDEFLIGYTESILGKKGNDNG